jgi:4,5-dihydroxyphthalate decarboxylase
VTQVSRVHLTFACGDYDRTRAVEDGTVQVDGVDLTYLRLPVEETFFRMLRHREFDVAEMSLSTYVATLNALEDGGEPPFVALPVYTSRMFRHGGIFINTAAGIGKPADLRGKVIGTPEYQLTACVWIRGILADEHDVPLGSVRYVTGGQEAPGRIEKGAVDVPFDVRVIRPGETLSAMLAAGEIDALYSPRIPSSFARGDGRVGRLFPDTVAAEKAYFTATGIFPIMHVVVLRREIYQRHRWVAQSLTKALIEAKKQAYARIYDASALRFMEPWLNQHLEDARRLLGADYWSYGLGEADHNVLATFLRYHDEQGLSRRLRTPEQLFAPEALEAFVI